MTARPVAVVTGAARGIGAAVASRLATDGYAVALADRDLGGCERVAADIERAGGRALPFATDVTDPESVAQSVTCVAELLGPLVVLVNNAGIIRDHLLFKMTDSDWDDVVAVHLRGAFLMSRATHAFMVERGWGRIVNISSTSALGKRGQANYAAAKAGLQGFTKTLAIELGPWGVTVNAVAPGFVVTDMTAETARRQGLTVEELQTAAAGQIPVRRVGRPEDVAATTAFLVSEEASYVSGQVIYVAGGPKC
jgi:3-oxoacyl-[acyl-carrier protein] reductase